MYAPINIFERLYSTFWQTSASSFRSASAEAHLLRSVLRGWQDWARTVAQSDPLKPDWDAVQSNAVECILGNVLPPQGVLAVPKYELRSLLQHHGYELGEDRAAELGHGSYGQVTRVRRTCDGRSFAMKRQTLSLTSISAETVLREISILNSSKGVSGLVQIEDAVIQAGPSNAEGSAGQKRLSEVWLFLEHFPGNLNDARGEFRSESSARHVVFQLLQGLRALHRADIIHRDLKPANVLVDVGSSPPSSARVVICDFGLSRSISDIGNGAVEIDDAEAAPSRRRRRPVSTNIVTAPWRAPELWGWADVERMSRRNLKSLDVFSLALVWAELLGGGMVISSQDGRDPPALRLLEILRRVDFPGVSTLEELGFHEEVSNFVSSVSMDDFAAIKSNFDSSRWPHDSLCRQGYVQYLLSGQSYRGIRSWVLRHAPGLSDLSPALGLIESASKFDYRIRPSSEELLEHAYFRDLHTEWQAGSTCERIADVGDALDSELQSQEAAYKAQAVRQAWGSVRRVTSRIRAEIALARSRGNMPEPLTAPGLYCPGSAVLLGRLGSGQAQDCSSERAYRHSFQPNTRGSSMKRPYAAISSESDLASPPFPRSSKMPMLHRFGCSMRKQSHG